MSLDSFNARALYLELKDRLLGSRLQKFSLLSADDVLLHLRSPGRTDKLILSVHPERSRFHLIGENHPPALVPNSFVMLGRKRIGGTRLISFDMPGLERRIHLGFHSGTSLVLDWSGRPSSLLLVDEEGICRGLHPSRGRFRLNQPNLAVDDGDLPWAYDLPAPEAYQALLEHPDMDLGPALAELCQGFSPLWVRRLSRALGGARTPADLQGQEAAFLEFWTHTVEVLKTGPSGPWSPAIAADGELTHSAQDPTHPSMNEAAAARWSEGTVAPGVPDQRSELLKRLKKGRDKALRKAQKRRQDRRGAETAERDKTYGDLLLAYAASIPRGRSEFPTHDWSGRPLTIPLQPHLTATENAEIFYRRSKKKKRALDILTTQIQLAEEEVAYWDELLYACEQAENRTDLDEVSVSAPGPRTRQGKKKKPEAPSSGPRRYTHQGFLILVGRNPAQNERLSLKQAARDDLWFHIKQGAGSHVLLKSGGRVPSEETKLAAAWLAARHSKAETDGQAEVITTEAKHLKKPKGGPPGKVIYRHESSIIVNPTAPPPDALEVLEPGDKKAPLL